MLLRIGLLTICASMIACSNAKFEAVEYQCRVENNTVVCPDGSELVLPEPVPGQDGADGRDGQDGTDGNDAVILTTIPVEAGKCVKVADGIYVENIRNGLVFDVYANDQCKDKLGEYCDNVEPSFGSSGVLGENKPGGAEVCWADNRMLSGERVGNDLLIRVLDFQ